MEEAREGIRADCAEKCLNIENCGDCMRLPHKMRKSAGMLRITATESRMELVKVNSS